jgi:hypothetical protein
VRHEFQDVLDEMQQMMAESLARTGIERVITQEILVQLVDKYLDVAKKELEEIGPEEDPDRSDYVPMATVLDGRGGELNIRCGWPDGKKRAMMFALSETCRTILAQGVIFRNVMTAANMEQIAKAMELNMPDPRNRQKVEYFEERMWKWIASNYGKARLAALPPELRWDGIVVAGFGPKLKECGRTSIYRWRDGKVEFEDAPPGYEMHIELIPRWWQ